MARSRDAIAIDEARQDDVEDEDDDDDDVADYELDQRGQNPAGGRVRVLPADPVGALLGAAEDQRVDVRYADDDEQKQNDDASVARRAEPPRTVRSGDAYHSL